MTYKELRDSAYIEATGQHLTEDFNYDDFQKISVSDYVWEPFEDWMPSMLEKQITGVAEAIIRVSLQYKGEVK